MLTGGIEMVSFLKKLFGKVESSGVQAADQAQTAATSAKTQGSSALTDARQQAGSAESASMPSNPLSNAASGVQDKAAAGDGGGLMGAVGGLFSGGIPNVGEIEGAIGKLSGPQLSGVIGQAMNTVPADARNQLGQLVNANAPQAAAGATSGVGAGNPADLGTALSGILKGAGGLGAFVSLFNQSGGAGASGSTGSAGGGLLGSVLGGEGGQLANLMKNPLAQQVINAILPAILKAAGK